MTRPAFRVGFDRYIDIQWADFAFELAQTHLPKVDKVRELRLWVNSKITGSEAAEKTANVLRNLWIEEYAEIAAIKQSAFEIGNNHKDPTTIAILSYGLALNIFPFFREVCVISGRLFTLQGGFHRQELHKRILERYGNLGSIPRASDRVIQSLISWGFLFAQHKKYEAISVEINFPDINSWVSEAVLYASPQRRLAITDLVHSPELMGIKLHRTNFEKSNILKFERDGTNAEFVYVRAELEID